MHLLPLQIYIIVKINKGAEKLNTATTYAEIQHFPQALILYIQQEYQKIQSCYHPEIPLEKHSISEIGAFVLIEQAKELESLEEIGLQGSLKDQCIEFVQTIPELNPICYDICILKDTDSGVRIIVAEPLLSLETKSIVEQALSTTKNS